MDALNGSLEIEEVGEIDVTDVYNSLEIKWILSRRGMDGPHQRGLVAHLAGTVASPGSVRDTAIERHSCQGNINAGEVLDKRCTHERGYAHVARTLDLGLIGFHYTWPCSCLGQQDNPVGHPIKEMQLMSRDGLRDGRLDFCRAFLHRQATDLPSLPPALSPVR